MAELESYTGNVWTHIISLKREDAARLGFDNAAAWRNLIQAHRNDIAAAMKIPSGDFRWYAAFHDEGEHPHIHMMAWSAKTSQAYLSKEGIRQIKSKLTNDIFRNEMLHLYEQKSESRDELVRQARRAMLELVHAMQDGVCDHPDAEQLMLELAAQLGAVKGKKSYGYLPKRLKQLVDEIVDEMERLPVVSKCYDQWLMLQGKVDSYYHDKPQERIPLSQQKEFRQIKNAIIQEAKRLHLGEITFEEKGLKVDAVKDGAGTGTAAALSFGTGGDTGTYYGFGSVLANYVSTNSDCKVTALTSGGSQANVEDLTNGNVQIAFVQSDVMNYAYNGQRLFESPVTGFSVVAQLYQEQVQIVTTNPDIKTVADLAGKKVSIGAAGSGVYFNAIDVLNAYDLKESDISAVYQSFGDSAESLKDGKIDAAFIVAGAPTTAITDLATAGNVYLVSLDDSHVQSLLSASPYYTAATIKAGTY